VVGKCDYSELFASDVIDDAVREFTQRKATAIIPPGCAKVGVAAQKRQCSFVFQNKCKTNLGIGFVSVEDSAFG
jgi:hypothetical protein